MESELSECRDLAAVASCGLRHALAAAETTMGNIRSVDWKTGNLEIVAQQGFPPEFLEALRIVTRMDGSSPGRAVALRRVIVIEDVEKDEGAKPHIALVRRAGFRAVQSTPLISSKGPICGVLSTHYAKPGRPPDRQLAAIADMAVKIADAFLRVRSAAQ
jgi:GAF domain-containing protein